MNNIEDTNRLAVKLFEARRSRITAETEEESLKGQLKTIMGTDEELETDLGTLTWKPTRDTEIVDWEAIASELKAPRWLIEKHSSIKPGMRRFCVPKSWDRLELKDK